MTMSRNGAHAALWALIGVIASLLITNIWMNMPVQEEVHATFKNRVENAVYVPKLAYMNSTIGWFADFNEFMRNVPANGTVYMTVDNFYRGVEIQKVYLAAGTSSMLLGYKETYQPDSERYHGHNTLGWSVKAYSDKEAVFSYSNLLDVWLVTGIVGFVGFLLGALGSAGINASYDENMEKAQTSL